MLESAAASPILNSIELVRNRVFNQTAHAQRRSTEGCGRGGGETCAGAGATELIGIGTELIGVGAESSSELTSAMS